MAETYLTDKILAKSILPIFPRWVKPNHLTIFRYAAVPAVAFLLWQGNFYAGLILFIITASTDALDGALARTRNQITDVGKIIDPLADKLLIGSAALIVVYNYLDPLLAIATVVMEVMIIAVALVKKIAGAVPKANFWGKIKMLLQTIGISLLLIFIISNFYPFLLLSLLIFYLSLIFGFISLLTYSA